MISRPPNPPKTKRIFISMIYTSKTKFSRLCISFAYFVFKIHLDFANLPTKKTSYYFGGFGGLDLQMLNELNYVWAAISAVYDFQKMKMIHTIITTGGSGVSIRGLGDLLRGVRGFSIRGLGDLLRGEVLRFGCLKAKDS